VILNCLQFWLNDYRIPSMLIAALRPSISSTQDHFVHAGGGKHRSYDVNARLDMPVERCFTFMVDILFRNLPIAVVSECQLRSALCLVASSNQSNHYQGIVIFLVHSASASSFSVPLLTMTSKLVLFQSTVPYTCAQPFDCSNPKQCKRRPLCNNADGHRGDLRNALRRSISLL